MRSGTDPQSDRRLGNQRGRRKAGNAENDADARAELPDNEFKITEKVREPNFALYRIEAALH